MATHPHLAYTVYDEATLFLRSAARSDFRTALVAQQIVCRVAALLGVFLMGRAVGLKPLIALLITALVNLGTLFTGAGHSPHRYRAGAQVVCNRTHLACSRLACF